MRNIMTTALALLLLSGCASQYDYKPGTQASDENAYNDQKFCDEKAWDVFFHSNHGRTIGGVTPIVTSAGWVAGLAIALVGTGISGEIAESTAERSKPGPYMKKDDMKPIYNKCMRDKGYVEKL